MQLSHHLTSSTRQISMTNNNYSLLARSSMIVISQIALSSGNQAVQIDGDREISHAKTYKTTQIPDIRVACHVRQTVHVQS